MVLLLSFNDISDYLEDVRFEIISQNPYVKEDLPLKTQESTLEIVPIV